MSEQKDISADAVQALVRERAENLYCCRNLCCSQAVLLALNSGFGGGLSEEAAINLGAGFCGGMGEAGCVCGGLAGAVMALGLFLGPETADNPGKKKFRKLSKKLHDLFQEQTGSTCCRVLIKDYHHDRKGQHAYCQGLTGLAAELAIGLLFGLNPILIERADLVFLRQKDSRLTGILKKITGPEKKRIFSIDKDT